MPTNTYERLSYIIVLSIKLYFYDNYLLLHLCVVIKLIFFGYDDVFCLENMIDLDFILYGKMFDEQYIIMEWKKIR